MKALVKVLILGVIFALSWLAYERVDKSETWDLKKQNLALSAEITKLQQERQTALNDNKKMHEVFQMFQIAFPGLNGEAMTAFAVPSERLTPTTQSTTAPSTGK